LVSLGDSLVFGLSTEVFLEIDFSIALKRLVFLEKV
jgi:hypothetical protein